MKEFTVSIREVLERVVNVNADNEEQALEIVKEMYLNEEIILDSNDFVDVEYENL